VLVLVVSCVGLWLALPFTARAIGLALFVVLALGALFPLLRFRWPSRQEGLSRLDRGTGLRHRPATALSDTLVTEDPGALALWQAQRERTLASIKRIRAGLPSPRLAIHDPWALRALIAVMMVAGSVAPGKPADNWVVGEQGGGAAGGRTAAGAGRQHADRALQWRHARRRGRRRRK